MSDDPRLFDIARINTDPKVRLRLDRDVLSTWDPALPREPRLLVPVDLRALVVPSDGGIDAVDVVPKRRDGDYPERPTPFAAGRPRAPGVWLHWAMPDGLTRAPAAAASEDAAAVGNALRLPPLPNRYLVVRMVHGSTAKRTWIVEADNRRAVDLSGWTESAAAAAAAAALEAGDIDHIRPESLHALAGGDPAWAACCDAVLDRFAFHDDLSDLQAPASVRMSYLVVGWWSDPSLDPLGKTKSVADMIAVLDERRWALPDDTLADFQAAVRAKKDATKFKLEVPTITKSQPVLAHTEDTRVVASFDPAKLGVDRLTRFLDVRDWPAHTLVHGVVHGVRGDGGGGDLQPGADDVELAVGGHAFGALSAMLADGTGAERLTSERLLLAFSAGLLPTIEKADGLVTVDEERHARCFDSIPGGTRTVPDRLLDGDPFPRKNVRASAPSKPMRTKATRIQFRAADSIAALKIGNAGRVRAQHQPDQRWDPRGHRSVEVPLPRLHYASDPAVFLRGAVRSERHGGDGRFEEDGRLRCRSSDDLDPAWEGVLEGDELPKSLRTIGSGAVPIEADRLLQEAVLTDSGRIAELSAWAKQIRNLPLVETQRRLQAELGWRTLAPEVDERRSRLLDAEQQDALRAASLYRGAEASPVAQGGWIQPWVPLFLDYELQVDLRTDARDWSLGDLDLEPGPEIPEGTPHTIAGRTLLHASTAAALHDQIQTWLQAEDQRDAAGMGHVGEASETAIRQAAEAAEGLDVLTGNLAALREHLLGLDPARSNMQRIAAGSSTPELPLASRLPIPFASGRWRFTRLRLVDAFGRTLDLSPDTIVTEIAQTHAIPEAPRDVLLPARITLPSRLMFRFVDAAAADPRDPEEARIDQVDPTNAPSPLVGFIMPDHVDEALELFDATGEPLGQLLHDPVSEAVIWEGAPGRPGPLGAPPSGPHPATQWLAQLATGLVRADATARASAEPPDESALSALLRGIDSTIWSCDPFAALDAGPIAGLLGRPLAVVRATLTLDVPDDSARYQYPEDGDSSAAARRETWKALAAHAIAVRLGELSRTNDGLLAWFLDDDYEHIRLVSPTVRLSARAMGPRVGHLQTFGAASSARPEQRPITHPYVDTRSTVDIHVGQRLFLTLLMLPSLSVHATTGVLPRKALTLARDWFARPLERLSPSFRVGPVLVEGDASGGVRLPRITGLGDKQQLTYKSDPLSWRNDPILAATQSALLPELPYGVREGWIRVSTEEDEGEQEP